MKILNLLINTMPNKELWSNFSTNLQLLKIS